MLYKYKVRLVKAKTTYESIILEVEAENQTKARRQALNRAETDNKLSWIEPLENSEDQIVKVDLVARMPPAQDKPPEPSKGSKK